MKIPITKTAIRYQCNKAKLCPMECFHKYPHSNFNACEKGICATWRKANPEDTSKVVCEEVKP